MTPDAELVERVRSGNVEAFGELAARYERSVLAVALAKLRDYHRAEDVVQATLLLAFRRLGTLRDGSKFGSWLMQIAQRQAMEALRTNRVPIGVASDVSTLPAREDSGERALIDNEYLLGMVVRLPEREQLLIGQRYFDGHSMAEIAAITGRPIGVVTKQLSRAIQRLRALEQKENRE